MSERLIETKCIIAGGGPAGVMLGYLLARAGIDVVVLEKWPDFFRDFRGDTIHPSTMEVLYELGLLEDFLKLPHNEMTRMTLNIGERKITVADFTKLHARCRYIAFIPQWDFLNFLSDKAKGFPSFHLMMETEGVDLIKEGEKVVGVRAKDKDGEFDIRATLVVGADGRHSTVREKGNFKVEELGVPIDVLWFRIGRQGVDDKQSLGYVTAGGALVMLDRRDYWQCAYIIEKGGYEKIKAAGLNAFKKTITATGRIPQETINEIDSWEKVKFLSVTIDHALRWAQDGVLLIGDSAHAMSPLGGVGINYAIHDAVAAGNILVPAFKKNEVTLAMLQKIQARREKPVRRMQHLQVLLQNKVISPILHQKDPLRVPLVFKIFQMFPVLRRIPTHIIGIGFGPEHVDAALD